ncbi:MAG: hypothetical protein IKG18_13270 [Atopobiaceae bacterium]|nr:hypothetical protein [Atopobiaceae bacterium]MBR3315094.1 hypothetical protein [Atopobiaceae bacterium]
MRIIAKQPSVEDNKLSEELIAHIEPADDELLAAMNAADKELIDAIEAVQNENDES